MIRTSACSCMLTRCRALTQLLHHINNLATNMLAINSCHMRSDQVVHIPSIMFLTFFSAPNLFQECAQSGRNHLQSSHRASRICAFCALWLFAVFWIVVSLISSNYIPRRYKLVTVSQSVCFHKSCSENTWYSAFQGTVLRSCSPQLCLGVPLLSIRLWLGPELDQRWCRITDRMSRPREGIPHTGIYFYLFWGFL